MLFRVSHPAKFLNMFEYRLFLNSPPGPWWIHVENANLRKKSLCSIVATVLDDLLESFRLKTFYAVHSAPCGRIPLVVPTVGIHLPSFLISSLSGR